MEIKLFSKWRPSATLNVRKLQFRSRGLYRHVILHCCSKLAKKRLSIWRPSAILNSENFDFLLNIHHGYWNVHLPTKRDRNRIIFGWDMEVMLAAVRHLEVAKIAVLVKWHISPCDPTSLFQIWRWSANMVRRYSPKTIFNMASVRHLGFVMTS